MYFDREIILGFLKKKRARVIASIAFMLFLVITLALWGDKQALRQEKAWGVTFSSVQAERLGLNPKAVFTALLEDLKVDHIRLPVYWDRVERVRDAYDFSETDEQLREAMNHGAEVILAVGHRVPRWPECFEPEWAKGLSRAEQQERILAFIEKTVLQYKTHSAVKYWQVENEPFLDSFGECPPSDEAFLKREVALVRSLDERPIVVTESGELSLWTRGARIADVLGVSMYRVVWSPVNGYFRWQIPAAFYRFKARVVGKDLSEVFNTELQAEPWTPSGNMLETPLGEQYKSMDMNQLRKNLAFAKKTGFSATYLWGVEWWYWLKEKQGIDIFWEEVRGLWNREDNEA